MRRFIRFLGFGLIAILGIVALGAAVIYGISESRITKTYSVDAVPPSILSNSATIERGRHLATAVSMCVACHTPSEGRPLLGGSVFLDIPPGRFVAPNLTNGAGGIGSRYTDADWARTIRHGVRPDGSPVLFMPSANYYNLSDDDLAAIIAFVKSTEPVDQELPASTLYPLGRALVAAGQFPLAAEIIDHNAPRIPAPLPGRTIEYGRYLVSISTCRDCHRVNLSGGPMDEPGAPPAPNLTSAGALKGWSEADFIRALREGVRPGGSQLRAPMPWEITAQMTDDELGAIYRYLQSLPPLPYNAPAQ